VSWIDHDAMPIPTWINMGGRLQGIVATLTCALAMLASDSRASAAVLSGAGAILRAAPVNGLSEGPWLWSFLNPWASQLSGGSNANEYYQGAVPQVEDSAIGAGGCDGTSNEDSSDARWRALLNSSLVFLARVSECLLSMHSTTSSSLPRSGPSPQASLPAERDVVCFNTAARFAREDSSLHPRDYTTRLFRPPRSPTVH
jgi:hypothetical protein